MTQIPPKILAADDDQELLKALSLRLWNHGYEMITATDSDQVLQLMEQAQPHMLVLDVNMPSGDGFSIHERVKKNPQFAAMPVIYLTGDKSSRLDEMASQLGAVALFHKPFSLVQLVSKIDQTLKNQSSRHGPEAA